MSNQMLAIRDLITDSIIRKDLADDPVAWRSICDAMDRVTDAPDLPGKLSAVNVLRAQFALAPITSASSITDIDAALAPVVDHLAGVRATAHRALARVPVPVSDSATQLGYALEKLGAVAGGGSNGVMAGGGLRVCRQHLIDVRDGMNARGVDGTERVAQAMYILERTEKYLERELDRPDADDLTIMASVALPVLIKSLDQVARELNAEDRKH